MCSQSGKLILVSGPSGVGKDTLLDVVLAKDKTLQKSISLTTRDMRAGETDGVDYFFIEKPKFQEMIDAGEVLEFAQYGQNMYGTPKKPVDTWLSEGKTVILKIEVKGASQIKTMYPDATAIFLMPPSVKALENRLRGRGTEAEEDLQRRMQIAEEEMNRRSDYDYVVVNDDLERAAAEVLNIIVNLK